MDERIMAMARERPSPITLGASKVFSLTHYVQKHLAILFGNIYLPLCYRANTLP